MLLLYALSQPFRLIFHFPVEDGGERKRRCSLRPPISPAITRWKEKKKKTEKTKNLLLTWPFFTYKKVWSLKLEFPWMCLSRSYWPKSALCSFWAFFRSAGGKQEEEEEGKRLVRMPNAICRKCRERKYEKRMSVPGKVKLFPFLHERGGVFMIRMPFSPRMNGKLRACKSF